MSPVPPPAVSERKILPPIRLPLVLPARNWAAVVRAMRPGLRLWLRQPWREEVQSGFSPGYVRLGVEGGHLLFLATLRDRHPQNRATRRNEETWRTGDVIELFFQEEGACDYYEFHVTPENQRLQLHFPDSLALRSGVPLATWMVEPDLFESATWCDAARGRWQVFIRVDLIALLGRRPAALRFLAGRYDAQPGGGKPVISCSGRLAKLDFHRLPEWTYGELAP